jgi:hypothetical protein
VKTYVSLVGTDTNADFNRAYDLIAPEFKHAQNDSDRDVYLNFHHQVWRYLKEITLDETWAASATIVPGAAGDKFEVMVGPERLTVQVVDMSPKELQDKGEHHWAVSHFLEPDPYADYFYKASQLEGTKALGGLSGAGPGLGKILDEITAMGSAARMSLWEAKITRLPLLNRPKGEGIDFHIIDLWRFRTDPVVRFMLERVVSGDDYKPSSKERAKAVLDGTLSEEERAVRGLE